MLIPVRCWTCGQVVAHYWEEYQERLKKGEDPKEILNSFGLNLVCCRRMLITHVDILDEVIKFSRAASRNLVDP